MAYMDYAFVLGRILYGGFFLLGGVIASGLLIIIGGLLVILGWHVRIALACIVVFLVPVTFLMHNYWIETDMMQRINQRVNFQKNVALLGAALMLLAVPK